MAWPLRCHDSAAPTDNKRHKSRAEARDGKAGVKRAEVMVVHRGDGIDVVEGT